MGLWQKLGFGKLKEGLAKTSQQLTDGIRSALKLHKLDDATCEALEEALIRTDIGAPVAMALVESLKKQRHGQEVDDHQVREILAAQIAQKLTPAAMPLTFPDVKPVVLLMVGVNGAGKTTTIGKLAQQLKAQGKKVVLAAGDTYRAAAVEQLATWADRAGVDIVKPEKDGADAAALLFKAYEHAEASGADILICDTAGRLQNRQDLMAQLEKMLRVLKKKNPDAPHATLLVLDATVGQNAHSQVETFKEMAGVTGLVVTKLDGTAKGGVVVALAEKFKLPIHFIGVGETIDDLKPFDAREFANALLEI